MTKNTKIRKEKFEKLKYEGRGKKRGKKRFQLGAGIKVIFTLRPTKMAFYKGEGTENSS